MAALTDTTVPTASAALDDLDSTSLVQQHANGRFGLHDLLREYALHRCTLEETATARSAAMSRLLDFYVENTQSAMRRLFPPTMVSPVAGTTGDAFGTDATALAWLDAEMPNLMAATVHPGVYGRTDAPWLLTFALRNYFFLLRRPVVDWLPMCNAALSAAEASDDLVGRAAAHLCVALAHEMRSHHDLAADHQRAAAELAERTDWRYGQAMAAAALGTTLMAMGRLPEAAAYLRRSLSLKRRLDWPGGQANDLNALGRVCVAMGVLHEAAGHFHEALGLYRGAGLAAGIAPCLGNLGDINRYLGRLNAARSMLAEARIVFHQIGSTFGVALAHDSLAEVERDDGQLERAIEASQAALSHWHEARDRHWEARSLNI